MWTIRILFCLFLTASLFAQPSLPLRQGTPPAEGRELPPLTLREATREDRWLGLGVRDVRWAPDGKSLYFRWKQNPQSSDNPDLDPWYKAGRDGSSVSQVDLADVERIPSADMHWSRDGQKAAWLSGGKVFFFDSGRPSASRTRLLYSDSPARRLQISADGRRVQFEVDQELHEFDAEYGALRRLTRKHVKEKKPATEAARWLEQQQLDLFGRHRRDKELRRQSGAHSRRIESSAAQPLPVDSDKIALRDIRLSPDRRFVTFRWTEAPANRPRTKYIHFADESGYAKVEDARPKVGEPQGRSGMAIAPFDPSVDPEEVSIVEVTAPYSEERPVIIYGPYWSQEGDQALVQVLSTDHKDRWISRLDLESGNTHPLVHDHDEAWLGGPPPVAGYLQPALLEWLPGGRFAFASERSGWSHLYLAGTDGSVRALTEGPWEVRGARLSRDRSFWLLQASREHPCDDHLYILPAEGGEMVRLSKGQGRHEGFLSPDGKRLATVRSQSLQLPDLFLTDPVAEAEPVRLTVSGTDHFYARKWVAPQVVSFPHPDGKPVWAALYEPRRPLPEKAAVLHIHGGGYRQFSHRGWSVYGWASHMGFIQYLVQQGYLVLDFDYRGSAGFGRDYRTDIYRSMGDKDVTGAVAAVEYLVSQHGADRSRIGVYGLSYGGFFTLSALFRQPGVFAAGVANAAVSDWAHYNHLWTSRILNLPFEDPEAYRASSPIQFADGLQDPLLIVHGLIDNNVQFQDAARLVQRLIELEKDFEVMYYPMERHVIRNEASRYDYRRRVVRFFERHLLSRP